MMVIFAPVSTKNRTSVLFTIPLTHRPSLSASTASVLTEGKVGLIVGGSCRALALELDCVLFPDDVGSLSSKHLGHGGAVVLNVFLGTTQPTL